MTTHRPQPVQRTERADFDGPAIAVRDVRVHRGQREIIRGVSFDVRPGAILVILGSSGSGKSTLLRAMLHLLPPSAGEVQIFGECLADADRERRFRILRRIGCSFQTNALFGGMTVGDNVALPLREHTELAESTIAIMVRMKLEQVGLSGAVDLFPSQLSGGMAKRAAVARALAMDPEILLFDEPSAGLDPITAAGIDQLVLQLRDVFQMTMVVVTHELESAFGIADQIVLLDQGKLLFSGTPQELRSADNRRVRQFIGREPDDAATTEPVDLDRLTGSEDDDGDGRKRPQTDA